MLGTFVAACASPPAGALDDPHDGSTGADAPSSASTTSAGEPGSAGGDAGGSTSSGASTTGDGAETDGDTDSESTGSIDDEGIGLFVASGHVGRTTVSCDAGQTWIDDQSLDDDLRCWGDGGPDCDHHVGSGTGLTWGGGWFVVTNGWGTEGTIRRSRDGVQWETTLTGPTFAGTSFGDGVFIAHAKLAMRADASATDWTDLGDTTLAEWTPRAGTFFGEGSGTFVITGGSSESTDMVLSDDAGASWRHPVEFPTACGAGIRGFAYGDGTLVSSRYGSDPNLCRSIDGGDHWETIDLGPVQLTTPPVFADGMFWVWSNGMAHHSPDGLAWESSPMTQIEIGAVAYGDGVFVAARDGWDVWYDNQEFYRSEDGVTWQVLQEGAFERSHPIRQIVFARIDPADSPCPSP